MEDYMSRRFVPVLLVVMVMALNHRIAAAQPGYDPAAAIATQRVAMEPLAFMNGAWRGTAWTLSPAGEKHTITQTERIGPFLDGSLKVIEGRGYDEKGNVSFNALGILSFNADRKAYTMHSFAMGHAGDFSFTPTSDGFTWEIPAGPSTMRYTAVVKDGKWHEYGDRIVSGQPPVRFFEMNLERIGDSDWPEGGALGMK
jgi:hypothetical protein